MTYGTLYGIGVGPGDPELMTLKAVRLIRQCPVLAAPQTASGQMLALDIARSALGEALDGGYRQKVHIATKQPFSVMKDKGEIRKNLENTLPAQCGLFWMPGRMLPC